MLPPAQKKAFQFILVHTAARGYPPTFREIAAAMGHVVNRAAQLVKALRRRGLLEEKPRGEGALARKLVVAGIRLAMIGGTRTLLFLPTPAGERAHREFTGGAA